MLTIGFSSARGAAEVLALPVGPDGPLPVYSPPAGDVEAVRIEAEQVQDGGVDVRDVMAMLDGVEAELVGGAVDDAAFEAAAR